MISAMISDHQGSHHDELGGELSGDEVPAGVHSTRRSPVTSYARGYIYIYV